MGSAYYKVNIYYYLAIPIWAIILSILFFIGLVNHHQTPSNLSPLAMNLIIVLAIISLIIWFIYSITRKIIIQNGEIIYHEFPLQKNIISVNGIRKVDVVYFFEKDMAFKLQYMIKIYNQRSYSININGFGFKTIHNLFNDLKRINPGIEFGLNAEIILQNNHKLFIIKKVGIYAMQIIPIILIIYIYYLQSR